MSEQFKPERASALPHFFKGPENWNREVIQQAQARIDRAEELMRKNEQCVDTLKPIRDKLFILLNSITMIRDYLDLQVRQGEPVGSEQLEIERGNVQELFEQSDRLGAALKDFTT